MGNQENIEKGLRERNPVAAALFDMSNKAEPLTSFVRAVHGSDFPNIDSRLERLLVRTGVDPEKLPELRV